MRKWKKSSASTTPPLVKQGARQTDCYCSSSGTKMQPLNYSCKGQATVPATLAFLHVNLLPLDSSCSYHLKPCTHLLTHNNKDFTYLGGVSQLVPGVQAPQNIRPVTIIVIHLLWNSSKLQQLQIDFLKKKNFCKNQLGRKENLLSKPIIESQKNNKISW